MAVLLGLAVALTYGAADFFGGLSSKRSAAIAVVVVSQASSLAVLAVLLWVDGAPSPLAGDLRLGAAAGTAGCIGLVLLYRGLATGRMGVVAPITAVGAAVVPFAWGIATGERPGVLGYAGVALALGAVVLVSGDTSGDARGTSVSARGELAMAITAGVCFGAVFVLLGNTSDASGFWPLAAARPTSIALLSAAALVQGQPLLPHRRDRGPVVLAGALDITANALYLLAVRRGLLSLVAVLGSLYPAATVVLAYVVLGERLRDRQRTGLLVALAGVALIAAA